MWTSVIRAAVYLAAIAFMMWVLYVILGQMVPVAMAGPFADNADVQTIKGFFDAMTLENLTALAGLATAAYLFGRAVVERRFT